MILFNSVSFSICNQLLCFPLINFNGKLTNQLLQLIAIILKSMKHGSFDFSSKSFQNIMKRVNQQNCVFEGV